MLFLQPRLIRRRGELFDGQKLELREAHSDKPKLEAKSLGWILPRRPEEVTMLRLQEDSNGPVECFAGICFIHAASVCVGSNLL